MYPNRNFVFRSVYRKMSNIRVTVRGRCPDSLLLRKGYADFAVTEDSELLSYGCKQVCSFLLFYNDVFRA